LQTHIGVGISSPTCLIRYRLWGDGIPTPMRVCNNCINLTTLF